MKRMRTGRSRDSSRSLVSGAPRRGCEPAALDRIAEGIGMAALDLAERARAAGLNTTGYLLECAALAAGNEVESDVTTEGPNR